MRTNRSWSRNAALAAALLVASASCTGGTDGDSVRVGALYPLSGSQGDGGVDEHRGVMLAAELANAEGATQVQLVSIDVTGSDVAPGAVASLADEDVPVVLGSYGSTISAEAARATAGRGMLFWETGAVGMLPAEARPGELTFRVPPTGAVLGRRAIEFIADRLTDKLGREPEGLRYGVTFVDDVYGRSVAGGAVSELRERGLPVVAELGYRFTTLDADVIARKLARARVDVLFVAAYLEDGIEIRRALVRNDVDLIANIGTSSSYCMPEFGEALGIDAVGVFASDKPAATPLSTEGLTPAAAELLERANAAYRERWGEDMSPAALAGFSAAWALFVEVVPRASATTPEALAAAARTIDLPRGSLPNGSGLRFSASGDNLLASSVVWEWVSPGHAEVVWPPEFATHPIDVTNLTP